MPEFETFKHTEAKEFTYKKFNLPAEVSNYLVMKRRISGFNDVQAVCYAKSATDRLMEYCWNTYGIDLNSSDPTSLKELFKTLSTDAKVTLLEIMKCFLIV